MMEQMMDYDDIVEIMDQTSNDDNNGNPLGNFHSLNETIEDLDGFSSTALNNENHSFMESTTSRLDVGGSSSSSSAKDIFYCKNYFDFEDILSQTIRIPVKFERNVPKLGFLDSSSYQSDDTEHDIVKGTKLELPVWLVKELNGDNLVEIIIPKGYNKVYREIMEADANFVNLNKLNPNFYLTGKHLTNMNIPESEDIALTMLDTFTDRFYRLVNYALTSKSSSSSESNTISKIDSMIKSNPHGKLLNESKKDHGGDGTDHGGSTSIENDTTINDLNDFVQHLDNSERRLFKTGNAVSKQIKRWENRDLTMVYPHEMVVNLKKRRILIEQQKCIKRLSPSSSPPPSTSDD